MTKQKVIQGYTVEIDGTDCFVTKGKFSASLAAMQVTGTLESNGFSESHDVPESAQVAIEQWAVNNGW
jgi:hypothetical protein